MASGNSPKLKMAVPRVTGTWRIGEAIMILDWTDPSSNASEVKPPPVLNWLYMMVFMVPTIDCHIFKAYIYQASESL